jgi:hypothetical protein
VNDHAYFVADFRGQGVQIVDLRRLRDPNDFITAPDTIYSKVQYTFASTLC